MYKKNLLILFVSILISGTILFLIYNGNQNVSKLNAKYAKASISIADDPYGRIEFERKMLADPATGKIPENIRQKELKFASTLPKVENISLAKNKGINTLTWNQRGPINRGGRTRALALDVRTDNATNVANNTVIIIAGGVSGGIWKSTDNGATWTNKLHADSIHSITCIAQDTRTGQEDTWYVGTGESQGSAQGGGSAFFRGDGVYKSTDNGDTWTLLSSTSTGSVQSFNTQWRYVNNIAVNKATGSVFAAATNAIYRSTNGGTTWTLVRSTLASSTMSDLQITSTGVIYVTIPSGFTHSGIWRSIDDGVTWTSITPTGFPSTYGRNVLGIAPSNENIVYFWVYTNAGATDTELWKYTYVSGDGTGAGGTWVELTSNLPTPSGNVKGTNVQGSYNMVIKIKPDDADFVIVGSTNLYRSTDGFSTVIPSAGAANWIGGYNIADDISQYVNHHPDQHSLVFLSSDPKVVYSGSDGGVSKTTDVTASNVTWSDLNTGYVTSQFYAIDIDPTTSGDPVIAGGMQDNGNYITFSTDFNTDWVDWNHGGDGAFAAVRKTGANEYTIYIEAQEGWLWRQKYNSAGTLTADKLIQPSISGTFAFVNPFMLDPNDNSIMYFANVSSVLRSTNVDETTPIWSDLTNATPGGSVSALAVSKSPTANILYVGGSTGGIIKITGANTGNPTATDISTGLPSGYVSCLWVQSDDQDNIIAVFSNYSVKSVWFSGNGGTSWSDISGNLEANSDGSGNGPSCRWVTAVTVGGTKTYYIATSTGLYSTSTLNGTSTVWAQEGSTAIGNVVSVMVKSRDSDGLVVVGTHGAGIYSANNDNTTTPTTQAINITFSNILTTSATISWTNGNGSNRAVFVKQGNSGTAAPVDNTTYTANTSFGSGTQIGATGWYNVYNGTSTSVGITNFAHGTEYRVMVVEYNGSAGGEDYNTNSATNNPNNFVTTISTPTLSSPLNAATGQALNVNLSWSSVSGADKYTLEVNTDNTFPGSTAVAVSGQPQSGTSKAPGGLSDNTTYYWRVTASNSSNGATSPVSSTFNFTTTQQSVSGILPTDNSFGIPLSPTLQWPAGPTGTDTYRLEVNTDNGFGSSTSVFDDATLTTNSKALSGLSNNTTYYWRVTAQSNLAKVTASTTNSFTTKLTTPTLTSPTNNSTDVSLIPTLSWSDVLGTDNYRLEVNTTSDFTGTVVYDQDTINNSSKQIGGLTDNTKYYWRVTALNNSGNSSDTSSTFNFTVSQTVLTSASNGATAVSTSPTLSWNKTSGANKYRLEVNTISDFTGTVIFDNATITDTLQAISGLSNNTIYYWRVTASSNALTKTTTSVVYNFTTKLSTPTLTSPVNNSTDVSLIPTLSWSDVSGADKYRLEVNTTSDFTGTVVYDQDTLSTSTKQIGGLTDNTKYYWRVTALNNTGNSSDTSSTFNFTVSQTVLTSASNGATAVSTSPTLSWNKTSGANKYRLEVNTISDFTGTVIFDNATITDTLQAISGLSNNTIYYWRVTASSNALTKTTTSDVYNFTTKLSTPTLTSPANNATDLILAPTLSWSAVTGADKYRLEVNTISDFTGTVAYDQDTVSTSTKQIVGLTDNTKYYWRVTALNNSGNSSDTSSTFNFTTETATGIETLNNIIPKGYSLSQNYPNPFNPSTIIRYGLPSESFVTIKIYNLLGQEINKLVHKIESAGYHEITFNSKKLASGIYFYRIIAKSADGKKDFITTKKLILMK